jgi:hypothetical protein
MSQMQARARRSDPDTSHEAARLIEGDGKAARHRRMLLEAVESRPGRTAAEYGIQTGLDRYEASRRLPELRDAEFIEAPKAWIRICQVRGTSSLTWWPPSRKPELKQEELF